MTASGSKSKAQSKHGKLSDRSSRSDRSDRTKDWWTIPEWIAEFSEEYGIANVRHLERCCAEEELIFEHSQHTCHLPDGWEAEKLPVGAHGLWILKRSKDKKRKKEFWTTDEWLELFGKEYGISAKLYLQMCCAQKSVIKNGRSYTYKLPDGWIAEKVQGPGRGIWLLRKVL